MHVFLPFLLFFYSNSCVSPYLHPVNIVSILNLVPFSFFLLMFMTSFSPWCFSYFFKLLIHPPPPHTHILASLFPSSPPLITDGVTLTLHIINYWGETELCPTNHRPGLSSMSPPLPLHLNLWQWIRLLKATWGLGSSSLISRNCGHCNWAALVSGYISWGLFWSIPGSTPTPELQTGTGPGTVGTREKKNTIFIILVLFIITCIL